MRPERRQHKRIFFSRKNAITVNLSVPGISRKTLRARILNLSEGGIAVSFRRDHDFTVVTGEFLSISEINGAEGLKCLQNKSVEVRWILDEELFETIGAGCKFYGFNDAERRAIQQFVGQFVMGNSTR